MDRADGFALLCFDVFHGKLCRESELKRSENDCNFVVFMCVLYSSKRYCGRRIGCIHFRSKLNQHDDFPGGLDWEIDNSASFPDLHFC